MIQDGKALPRTSIGWFGTIMQVSCRRIDAWYNRIHTYREVCRHMAPRVATRLGLIPKKLSKKTKMYADGL